MQPTVDTVKEEKNEEEVDIDLDDPEVEKAAVKIQAGFKGMKTRKELNTQQVCQVPVPIQGSHRY